MADRQGSITDLLDGAGVVQYHFDYDGYGNATGSGSDPSFADRYRYTGREYNADTGLQHHDWRWYDPGVGRWTGDDPSGFTAGDPHLQRYVFNRPTNASDPDGRRPIGLPSPGVFQLLPAGAAVLLPAADWIADKADTAVSVAGVGTALAVELWNRDPDQVLDDATEFAKGVGEGLMGWVDLGKMAVDAAKLLWRYRLVNTCLRLAQGDTFEDERRYGQYGVKAGKLLLQVQQQVAGRTGEYIQALWSGNTGKLQQLPAELGQVWQAAQPLLAKIKGALEKHVEEVLKPRGIGKIVGMVLYEVTEAAVLGIVTAGASAGVTAGKWIANRHCGSAPRAPRTGQPASSELAQAAPLPRSATGRQSSPRG